MNWLTRTTPVPNWALVCFAVSVVSGALRLLGL